MNLSTVKLKSHVLKSRLYSGNKPITITLPTKKLDKMAIKRSVMPNLIHSMDASSLALLANLFFEDNHDVKNFYSIHDCFAVTANNVSKLIDFIKLVYIKIKEVLANTTSEVTDFTPLFLSSKVVCFIDKDVCFINKDGRLRMVPNLVQNFFYQFF